MRFLSTHGEADPVGLSEAISRGLAADGGLYVPEEFPEFRPEDFDDLTELPQIAERVLSPFFEGDPLEPHLGDICRSALDFPLPLRSLAR